VVVGEQAAAHFVTFRNSQNYIRNQNILNFGAVYIRSTHTSRILDVYHDKHVDRGVSLRKGYRLIMTLIASIGRPQRDASAPAEDAQMQESVTNAAAAAPTKRRPKLDLTALGVGGGERKRGKSMFGVLVNTLNKAKAEDKERNASEAVSAQSVNNAA
jgi:hypothetical protein